MIELSKAAAVVILTSGIGYLLYAGYGSTAGPTAMQTVSVPAGSRVNVTLSDGTGVWLNSLSSLSYPVSFGKRERRVFLDGSAYMEVSPDAERKFTVTTDRGGIEVLGTSFVVDAYSGSDTFEVFLKEGSLNVWGKSDPERVVRLAPDMRATVTDGNIIVRNGAGRDPFDWERGLIAFEEMTFARIMELFEKYYGVTIVLNNGRIGDRRYTGKFRQADGVDYALRIMQKDIGFEYSKDNEKSVIMIE